MTDEEFLAYVETHCETPRALFSASDCERLYAMAGLHLTWKDGRRPQVAPMYPTEAKPLVQRARIRITVH